MDKENLERIENKLIDVLSSDKGYFGRVDTWGQRPNKYEYIGYILDTNFMPVLESLPEEKIKCLVRIINYFEIHANPLKKMIIGGGKENLYDFYSDWAWSHFMTVIIFGMLEVAVKNTPSCIVWLDEQRGYIKKYQSIVLFLETNLPQDIRDSITKRYKTETGATLESFSDVIKNLWDEIRSGFVHDAGVHYKGMEWNTLSGAGSKDNPIKIESDVPMQELLQITWQAILNSFGYEGLLILPKYKI
jgi:hypothetical protein